MTCKGMKNVDFKDSLVLNENYEKTKNDVAVVDQINL